MSSLHGDIQKRKGVFHHEEADGAAAQPVYGADNGLRDGAGGGQDSECDGGRVWRRKRDGHAERGRRQVEIDATSQTDSIGGAAAKVLAEQMLANNSVEVDGVTAATVTSDAVKAAAAAALAELGLTNADLAKVEAADEVLAVSEAERQLEETAAKDKTLLANAQQRAKSLLEEYIKNIGEAVGEEYKIDWIYVDASGNPLGTAADASAETASAETGAEMPAA